MQQREVLPGRFSAPYLSIPQARENTRHITSSFKAAELKFFPKQETFLKILDLLPAAKGVTSMHLQQHRQLDHATRSS